MKYPLILFTLALVSSLGIAQNSPKIEFKLKENTIDFGILSIKKNSVIRTVEFKNTGDSPLLITNVFSTSSFTFPSRPREPILPGKSAKIIIKYNMIPGPIRKTITVETNAVNYEGGIVALKVKGNVIEE
jgi:hypothetical protein